MLSKNKIKLIQSLKQKKFRQKYNIFLAEGDKIIRSFLDMGHEPEALYILEDWWKSQKENYGVFSEQVEIVNSQQLKQISMLASPPPVAGLFVLKSIEHTFLNASGSYFYLDGIQDPGNLGTVIRTLDWFGENRLYLSKDCVDPFNPKTVQASMGSVLNLNYFEADLAVLSKQFTIYGSSVEGEAFDKMNYKHPSLIVLGNEGHGIRSEQKPYIHAYVGIPRDENSKVESLNAAVSLAIICADLKRRKDH